MAAPPAIKPGIMINNKAALNRKLKEMKLNYDWIETLVLTNPGSDEGLPDDQVDHDFNREMHFYRQAQTSVLEGLKRLHSLSIPTRRPDDYFAEMAKSDAHMLKVKKALAEREAVLSKIERAKKMRQEKKMAKMVQNQVKIAKQQEKKELMTKVARYQKGKEKNLDFLNDKPAAAAKKKEAKPPKKVSKKVLHKKKVYGFGGQKKRSKYNTAESAADVSSFRKGRSRAGPSRGASRSGGKGGPSRSGGKGGPSRGGAKGGPSRGGGGGGVKGVKGPRSKPQARRGKKR